MRYVGVDVSLTGTAMVSLDVNGKVTSVIKGLGYSLPESSGHWENSERTDIISNGVVSFIGDCPFAAIEGYSYGSKGKRSYQIGELGGVIKHKLLMAGHESKPTIVAPTSLKKFTTGSGQADKIKMALWAFKKWGFEGDDDNVTDAYCLAQMMRHSDPKLSESLELTKYEVDALRKIGVKLLVVKG